MRTCSLRITLADYDKLYRHLFPGDHDEHGAVLLAGIVTRGSETILLVREVHPAIEGTDYVESKIGYRALSPKFIHKYITRARDLGLVYLAVHNHSSTTSVQFSTTDFDSHARGYPALLQIANGMPVGALVCGTQSMQADIWFPGGTTCDLEKATIIGRTIYELYPHPKRSSIANAEAHSRQINMFGARGQARLEAAKVGIIGLGGVGSLLAEYLARLGIGQFLLVDDDRVEHSNLSRLVGATEADIGRYKVDLAAEIIHRASPEADVTMLRTDVTLDQTARELSTADYLFLAADSMRARLVFNGLIHQYLLPGAQVGSKIRVSSSGEIIDIHSVNRTIRPGLGCLLCNGLIDPTQLALEAKSDAERKAQAYGTSFPNPSVITLNAAGAAAAANDFLLDYLAIRNETPVQYEHLNCLLNNRLLALPRADADCSECSRTGMRFARGDGIELPVVSSRK